MSLRTVPAFSVGRLAAELASQLRSRENPLVPETVLIMNFAQKILLRREIARHNGICANLSFKAPDKFLRELIVESAGGNGRFFDRTALAWQIFEILKKRGAAAGTENPAGTPADDSALFGLRGKPEPEIFCRAVELGDLFWRYQNFRPQMICDWTNGVPAPRGADADFLAEYTRQRALWRELGEALNFEKNEPTAVAWKKFLRNKTPPAALPPRIFVFAPSALPHIHAALLEKLAAHTEIFLFWHNLSDDLWTETLDRKTILRERAEARRKGAQLPALPEIEDDESLAGILGNPLLLTFGKAAKPLARRLAEIGALDSETTLDAPPPRDSLLHSIQRDIRKNVPAPLGGETFVPAADDSSLRIFNAPNPLREMEILRDELLRRFAEDKTLHPSDVIVALADIETYAPFVRAAFGNSGIPFTLADRAGTEIFPIAAAFTAILDAARGELRLEEIAELLDRRPIREALGLSENDALELPKTLAEAGISWGADADFRRERIFGKNFSEVSENEKSAGGGAGTDAKLLVRGNAWTAGKRRLALGFMCGNDEEIFLNFAENSSADAQDSATQSVTARVAEDAPAPLGKIFRLVALLGELRREIAAGTEKSVPAWCEFLCEKTVGNFLDSGNGDAEIIRRKLAELSDAAQNGAHGVPAACTLETVFCALDALDWSTDRSSAFGLLQGKVTFCKLQPQRNIPARIICIAGLGDMCFPRPPRRSSLDLTQFPPENFRNEGGAEFWDRTPRTEDGLLFLETVLAARDALVLSYVGRDARDGAALPPCLPLAKLRDYAAETLVRAAENSGAEISPEQAVARIENAHRLYGFDAAYFTKYAESDVRARRFFSYSEADFRTAKRAAETADSGENAGTKIAGTALEDFLKTRVPAEISQSDFAFFFRAPAEFICEKILNARRNFQEKTVLGDDPQNAFEGRALGDFHRFLLEKLLGEVAGGNGENASENLRKFRDAALAEFRKRERAAGRSAPLVSAEKFTADALGKLKDFDGKKGETAPFPNELPLKLSRVGPSEFPAALEFEIPPGDSAGTARRLRVFPEFANLFRKENGEIFLAILGNKNFGVCEKIEMFIAAALLAKAFPQQKFTVAHFNSAKKSAPTISEKSLDAAFPQAAPDAAAQFLAEFFVKNFAAPPLFFDGLADLKFGNDSDKKADDSGGNEADSEQSSLAGTPDFRAEFCEKALEADDLRERNACEELVFGNVPEKARAAIFREKVFPFFEKFRAVFPEKSSTNAPKNAAKSGAKDAGKNEAKPARKPRARQRK